MDPDQNNDVDQILDYIDRNDETGYNEYNFEEIRSLAIHDLKEALFYMSIPVEFLIMPLYTVVGIFFAIFEGVLFQFYPDLYDQLKNDDDQDSLLH